MERQKEEHDYFNDKAGPNRMFYGDNIIDSCNKPPKVPLFKNSVMNSNNSLLDSDYSGVRSLGQS